MVEQWPYTSLDAAPDHFGRNEDGIFWERVQLDEYQLFTLRCRSKILRIIVKAAGCCLVDHENDSECAQGVGMLQLQCRVWVALLDQ